MLDVPQHLFGHPAAGSWADTFPSPSNLGSGTSGCMADPSSGLVQLDPLTLLLLASDDPNLPLPMTSAAPSAHDTCAPSTALMLSASDSPRRHQEKAAAFSPSCSSMSAACQGCQGGERSPLSCAMHMPEHIRTPLPTPIASQTQEKHSEEAGAPSRRGMRHDADMHVMTPSSPSKYESADPLLPHSGAPYPHHDQSPKLAYQQQPSQQLMEDPQTVHHPQHQQQQQQPTVLSHTPCHAHTSPALSPLPFASGHLFKRERQSAAPRMSWPCTLPPPMDPMQGAIPRSEREAPTCLSLAPDSLLLVSSSENGQQGSPASVPPRLCASSLLANDKMDVRTASCRAPEGVGNARRTTTSSSHGSSSLSLRAPTNHSTQGGLTTSSSCETPLSPSSSSSSQHRPGIDGLLSTPTPTSFSLHGQVSTSCPFSPCPRVFGPNHANAFKRHVNSHIKTMGTFLCTHCQCTFSRKHDLKRHSRKHTGHKPYECQVCGSAFARSDSLRLHWKRQQNCRDALPDLDTLTATMRHESSSPVGAFTHALRFTADGRVRRAAATAGLSMEGGNT